MFYSGKSKWYITKAHSQTSRQTTVYCEVLFYRSPFSWVYVNENPSDLNSELGIKYDEALTPEGIQNNQTSLL